MFTILTVAMASVVCIHGVGACAKPFWLGLTLCDPTDCSPPNSSVHGILQARTVEGVAISSSRGSSRPRGLNPGLLHCRQILDHLTHQGYSILYCKINFVLDGFDQLYIG